MFIPTPEEAARIKTEFGTPAFVTDAARLRHNAKLILDAFADFDLKVFYAIKANYNPHIVRTLKEAGVYGIDAVSPNEVKHALSIGYQPEEIIYTPSNASNESMKMVGDLGVMQNLGSLSELERYGQMFPGTKISFRISPEVGAGEFEKVKTGGENTKFGLLMSDLEQVKSICRHHDLTPVGIHSHIGSGFYEPGAFRHSVEAVLKVARQFLSVEFVDFGGGFGVKYRPSETPIDLHAFAEAIKAPIADYEAETNRKLELRIEPGKFLVSTSTVLMAEITTVKKKGTVTFVGLNSGFHHLIRPAMYGAYQHVINASRPEGPMKWVEVVGNVCETCDVFNGGIDLSDPQEGDVIAILVAGGYGASMSSNYNMRGRAAEVLVDGKEMKLTRRHETYDDITSQFCPL
ncbi:diaminopimelate decarboxylase [Candidatus Nomurabacteria bacterium]|nr:diaminopimelate decarboxylase [Candidatus Nomurabacteria bacterium]